MSQNLLEDLRSIASDLGEDVAHIAEYVAFSRPEFCLWSGSIDDKHHYGVGGLLRHTHEVVHLCLANETLVAQFPHTLSRKVLFLAAVAHDIGKTFDYEPIDAMGLRAPPPYHNATWCATPHKRLIHHISRSAIEWTRTVESSGECRDIQDSVLHCILSHHGHKEWGSPVEPQTKEAWLLHLCDGTSARMDDCDRTPPRP